MIRTLIVDDEPLAREGLRLWLEVEPDVEIVGEAADVVSAAQAIRDHKPDLVLLDVQMPAGDGFEVLEKVAEDHLPLVVFVTAHDEHALRAFDAHALDYLLKPVSEERFREAIRRVRNALGGERGRRLEESGARLATALDARDGRLAAQAAPLSRLVVRDRDRYHLVHVDSVDWISSAQNYVEVHAGASVHLVRETIADLAARLDPARFVRIHRSTIVQLDRIREIVPNAHGDFDVVLRDGTVLRMSRTYRAAVLSV